MRKVKQLFLLCGLLLLLTACTTTVPDQTAGTVPSTPVATEPATDVTTPVVVAPPTKVKEKTPAQVGSLVNDTTAFTLESGDSKLELAVRDNSVFLTAFGTKASGANRAQPGATTPFALPSNYWIKGSSRNFQWQYEGYRTCIPEGAENGQYGYIFQFKDKNAQIEYDLIVTAHADFAGPFEFTGYLFNGTGEDIEYGPRSYFRAVSAGAAQPTVWSFNKESGVAEGYKTFDGRYYPGTGIYKKNLAQVSTVKSSCNTNQDHNTGGQIPLIYLDYQSWGMYYALEWTNGTITAAREENNSCSVAVELGDSKTFKTVVPAGDWFYMPTVYMGVYDGDVDMGSNVFKRWYLYNKAPDILLENKNEPLIQQDMQIGLDASKYGIETIKWDYGWWSNVQEGSWRTHEGLLEVHNTAYLGAMASVGAKSLKQFVDKAELRNLSLTTYILLKDTELDQAGVPTSIGQYGHPEWFANRNVTGIANSADLGNEECVEFYKDYLLNFFQETGVTTWRSDFEPICRSSNQANRHYANGPDVQYWCSVGFYDLVDHLYENVEGFRYESCSSGGAMKDFSTMRRAVVLNCDDSADFQSLKMSFYDSSYCFHPAQLQMPTNAGTYTEGYSYYAGFGDHDYGLRSQMLGAVMLCNWGGTTKEDIASWQRLIPDYRNKVRPLIKYGDLYHVLPRPDGVNWDGLFYVDTEAESDTKGVLMIFKPTEQAGDTTVVKLRGLEPDVTYSVEFDDHYEQNVTMTGAQLMETGLTVTFTDSYDSDWVWIVEP